MKTGSTFLQTLALSALLVAQLHGAITMPGVRQALRIIAGPPAPIFCSSALVKDASLRPAAYEKYDPEALPACP